MILGSPGVKEQVKIVKFSSINNEKLNTDERGKGYRL